MNVRGSEYQHIIRRLFGEVRNYGREQIQVNCPKCQERDGLAEPDGKFNLEINTAMKKFHCWKCDEPKFYGNVSRLIRTYGIKYDYDEYVSYSGVDVFNLKQNDGDVEKYTASVKLPHEMILFSSIDVNNKKHIEAYQYLVTTRRISRDVILKFRVGFCLEGKYANRIIIPSYNKFGDVNYFVGRTYLKGLKPTYLNPVVDKDLIIFNEGMINWDSTVYIVEGAFEVLSFPINTIPLLGKSLNKTLFNVLKHKKPNVIVILDPDAFKENLKLYQEIKVLYSDCPEKVKFVTLQGNNDLDEIKRFKGKEEVIKQIRTAKEPTDLDLIRASIIIGNNKKKWDWLGIM